MKIKMKSTTESVSYGVDFGLEIFYEETTKEAFIAEVAELATKNAAIIWDKIGKDRISTLSTEGDTC